MTDQQPHDNPLSTLRKHFGFDSFRGIQSDVINHVLAGKHAMVVMPTGAGKSLCYQVPALMATDSSQLTVVLSPLIALMQDQVAALQRRGIPAVYINSSLDRQTRKQRYKQLANGEYRLLYVTPERFRKEEFLESLQNRDIHLLAIDEAHCVSQWGHDFRPDYSRAADIRQLLGSPTTVALTATATSQCRSDIYLQLGIGSNDIRLFHEGIERPNLNLDVQEVWDEEEKLQAIRDTLADPSYVGGSRIIYFSLIKTLERFSDSLRGCAIDHSCYHGDLPRSRRYSIQEQFMSAQCNLVLATNAFGMGIDKSDIRILIHAETPGSIEAYYQEVGRAGRDGAPSLCRWLYAQNDLLTQMQFIEWSNPGAEFYSRVYTLLTEHPDKCRAFGIEWMNERLQKVSKHDNRIMTAIAMLDRHGVLAGPQPPECFEVLSPLPAYFTDEQSLNAKKLADQQRLYAMVQYAAEKHDRKAFLNNYFMNENAQSPLT